MSSKHFLSYALETAFKQYLSLDENSHLLLTPLAGKVIAITVEPFKQTFYLCPTETTLQFLDNFNGKVDTTLTGSLIAFGQMGLSNTPMQSLFSGDVTMRGDSRTGRKFQQLFDKLDINLENKLSNYTGHLIADKFGKLFRKSANWGQETQEIFKLNVTEFLQEETRDSPTKIEANIFYANVDKLRMDFDRLDARIKRLQTFTS